MQGAQAHRVDMPREGAVDSLAVGPRRADSETFAPSMFRLSGAIALNDCASRWLPISRRRLARMATTSSFRFKLVPLSLRFVQRARRGAHQ